MSSRSPEEPGATFTLRLPAVHTRDEDAVPIN
jgi:hypothetical protein